MNDEAKYRRLRKKYGLESSLPERFGYFKIEFPKDDYKLDDDVFPITLSFMLDDDMERTYIFLTHLREDDTKLTREESETVSVIINDASNEQKIERLRKGIWNLRRAYTTVRRDHNNYRLAKTINEEYLFYKKEMVPLVELIAKKLKSLPNAKKKPVTYIA